MRAAARTASPGSSTPGGSSEAKAACEAPWVVTKDAKKKMKDKVAEIKEAEDDKDPDDSDEDEKEEVKGDVNEEEEKAKRKTKKPLDIKSLEERLKVTKANMKGLGKNLVDIAKKRKKSQAKLASGCLKEGEVPGKIEEDAKKLEEANPEMKADKLSSRKSRHSEDVHQEAAEKAERKGAIRRRKRTRRKKRRKMHTVRLRLPWGHHSTPGPSGREAARTQASVGQEVPCPSSHPQDLRVKHGEGGPPPQVTWRHIT